MKPTSARKMQEWARTAGPYWIVVRRSRNEFVAVEKTAGETTWTTRGKTMLEALENAKKHK